MKVDSHPDWYRFLIPIPSLQSDTEESFLERVREVLNRFYIEHTECPLEWSDHSNPLRICTLESLKGKWGPWNFSDFRLRGLKEYVILFYVGTPSDNYGTVGINVYCGNSDRLKAPMMTLKTMWTSIEDLI
jgi:hypothetical protein